VQRLNKIEEQIFRLVFEYSLTEQEATRVIEEQERESKEELADDEWRTIELELEAMLQELSQLEFEIYLERKHGVRMSSLSTKQMEEENHLFREEQEKESRAQYEELNRSMDAKLQRRIRRSSPEYQDNTRIRYLFDKNIQMP
jgi:hypothetical protein